MSKLRILYRGPLDSCNYDCSYCPFAKKKNTREELRFDKACLSRFVQWVSLQKREISILFTPWGEALIRNYYQEAICELSHMSHVSKVSIQTNLSGSLAFLSAVEKKTLALWTTFHPTEITVEAFVNECLEVQAAGVNFSVGVVGLKEHFDLIEELRQRIPNNIYVWVNAYKREPNYYSKSDVLRLESIDPHFGLNNTVYSSFDKSCSSGESSVSIDGLGNVYRCHFIKNLLGNIYEKDIEGMLESRRCSKTECRCYIGYINIKELHLEQLYGDQILERIPLMTNTI